MLSISTIYFLFAYIQGNSVRRGVTPRGDPLAIATEVKIIQKKISVANLFSSHSYRSEIFLFRNFFFNVIYLKIMCLEKYFSFLP